MASKLIAKKGPASGVSYALEQQEIFIGRDLSNDIVINDPEISRRHARLYKQGNAYVLEDLGSTNGTSVNSKRLTGPCKLNHGEVVEMGPNISFTYESDEPINSEQATVAVASLDFDEGATLVADQEIIPLGNEYIPPAPNIPSEFAQVPEDKIPQDNGFNSPAFPSESQSPSSPQTPEKSGKNKSGKKRKFPIWILIAIIALLLLCVVVGGLALWYIDVNFLWCDILPFLPGCLLN
ncbi:MAG: FHA domain-containing protein [Anaerolineaceae bacterium]|nr:FHA domain-containing protein [Anaerolineaceae bacterium]